MQSDALQAQLLVVNTPGRPIIPGQHGVLHVHSTATACRISKLVALLDAKTGAVAKRGPGFRVLLKDQMAVVEISLDEEVCMEAMTGQSCLKRLVLRIGGVVVAVGTMQEVLESRELERESG